ncbi:hypothetical protein ACVWZ6_002790 [Bradyrhizobium sp. GM6.1]
MDGRTKATAELVFEAFIKSCALKYEKAADCLRKDRDTLVAFYDFPADHWKHLRTTDEMDKRFLHGRGDDCGDRRKSILFVRSRCGAIVPSRPPISQPPRAGAVKAGRVCGHRKAWP